MTNLGLRLFVPFYAPRQAERRAEILECTLSNIQGGVFDDVILLLEKEEDLRLMGNSAHYVRPLLIGRRPTYADWIRAEKSGAWKEGAISVFANTDIFFPHESSNRLRQELTRNHTVLCISRHEHKGPEEAELHPSPHWSQDAWCIRSTDAWSISQEMERYLEIPVGTPRCDNRLAYVFWLNSWVLVNPCQRISILHYHRSAIREYKKSDRSILGGALYVHPSNKIGMQSEIEIDLFTLSRQTPMKISANTFLINIESRLATTENDPQVSTLDYENSSPNPGNIPWQEPNRTERHAAERIGQLEQRFKARYVEFPWASWIDRRSRGFVAPALPLQRANRRNRDIIATVCQHIWALDNIHLFLQAGVTDLFWSHATKDCTHYEGLRIHPFPLYPVRCVSHPPQGKKTKASQRKILFSFQGAYSPGLYLTPVREWISELAGCTGSRVSLRPEWHFEQEVYREQVLGGSPDPTHSKTLEQQASEYSFTLQDSCFALCPSGSGPNTIRIWEALGYGAIPVILSDSLLLPGDYKLWQQAALIIPESRETIARLPSLLAEIASNPQDIDRMQLAGRRLWEKYGPDRFTNDIVDMLTSPASALLAAARRRLGEPVETLAATDPSLLPREIQRWLRVANQSTSLLIQINDHRPLDLVDCRWKTSLQLCQDLLTSRRWAVSSLSPRLEAVPIPKKNQHSDGQK